MRRRVWTVSILFASLIASGLSCLMRAAADEAAPDLTSAQVKDAIDRVQKFLGTIQNRDGSFGFRLGGPASNYGNTGVTGLVVLALLSSGLPPEHAVVADGLKFLRTAREPQDGFETYQTAVMIMALAAAKQPDRDMLRIQSLAHKLESMQITRGVRAGMWNYGHGLGLEDNSNSQFAVLGLREAAVYGVTVSRRTWELAGAHYIETQNPDGGWGYHVGQSSTGSMTCSGIGSLVICDQMLSSAEDDKNDDGTPKCCSRTPHANRACAAASTGWDVTSPSGPTRASREACGPSTFSTALKGPAGSPDSDFSDRTTGTAKGPRILSTGNRGRTAVLPDRPPPRPIRSSPRVSRCCFYRRASRPC